MADEIQRNLAELRDALMRALGGRADLYPSALEARFPHILEQLASHWGRPRLDDYLEDLTLTNRPGRQGFPDAVATELFRLAELHRSFGFRLQGPATAWDWAADVDIDSIRRSS